MEHLQFNFENLAPNEQEIVIARLNEAGFAGFEQQEDSLTAYIASPDFDKILFDSIVEENNLTYSTSTIEETNWNALWESNFEPVTVDDPISNMPFASIRANFHEPEHRLIHELVITPKMSFGTGHHATTYLMIERMSQLEFDGKTVIDFGTGTGVLAILAEKLGAEKVIAIDNDDWSIENTRENVEANDCHKIDIRQAGSLQPITEKADVILANINLPILRENMDNLHAVAEQGSIILFSGVMVKDKEDFLADLSASFFDVASVHERDHWICVEAMLTEGNNQPLTF